jgi:large subunit ribosomal protein L23
MSQAYELIIKPVVSEKSTRQMEESNSYTFKVASHANKVEIAKAVEKLFDVTVLSVRTMTYPGKARRPLMGRLARKAGGLGRRAGYKKAVVTLAEGDHIELYEVG